MNHARTRRWVAGSALMTLLGGLLTLVVMQPAAANHGTRTLQVVPEITTRPVGQVITLTAKLSSAADTGIRIAFEVEGGPSDTGDGANYGTADKFCTVAATATTCTTTYTSASPGNTTVRAWIDHDQKDLDEPGSEFEADLTEGRLSSQAPAGDAADCRPEPDPADTLFPLCANGTATAGTTAEPDDTDVVEIIFTGGKKFLDCVDSNPNNGTDTEVNQSPANEAYRCRALTAAGVPISGIAIDAENLDGLNDPDNSAAAGTADYTTNDIPPSSFCRTGSDGSCTATISGAEGDFGNANATICFWLDEEGAGSEDNTFTPGGSVEDGGDCGEAVATNDADPTDTVSIGWRNTAPTGSAVDVNPENVVSQAGTPANVTATIFDQYGDRFVGSTVVKAELFGGSVSDSDGNAPAAADVTCTSSGADNCTLSFTSAASGVTRVCTFVGAGVPVMAGTVSTGTCDGEDLPDGTIDDQDVHRAVFTTGPATTPTTQPTAEDVAKAQGYTLVGADGGIFNFGTSTFHGSTGGMTLNKPVIGMASKRGGTGYWLVASDGGVFTFGDAEFFGSMGGQTLNAPVLGMEATPSGKGYFLFAADGGIFTFGDAAFQGSTGAEKLNQPVVGMAVTEKGDGYWLVARDGGIFSFNAPFHGSMGGQKLNQPIFDMGSRPGDVGYWLVARDGGVFTFGNADFYNSAVGATTNPVIGLGVTPTGNGYWVADSRGAVFPFGDARFLGDRRNEANNATTVGFATVPRK